MSRRIRTVKPEITENQKLAKCSMHARLAFVYLITNADDEGRMRGNAVMLARTLFPYDDDAQVLMDGWIRELETIESIRRYQFDGSDYLEIINWKSHQRIEKPKLSKLPTFTETSVKRRRRVTDKSPTRHRHVDDTSGEDLDQGSGSRIKDQDQDQDSASLRSAEPSPAPADVVNGQKDTTAEPEQAEAPKVAEDEADDYELMLWRNGPPTLVELHVPERQARSMIGKWLKAGNDHRRVYELIMLAREKHILQPIEWITKAIGINKGSGKTDAMMDGLRRQYERTFGADDASVEVVQ